MIALELSTTAGTLRERMAAIRPQLKAALVGALRDLEPGFVRTMQANLPQRTGRLRRSVRSKLREATRGTAAGAVVELAVSAGSVAPILKRGATITPQRAQLLAIPVGAAITGRISALSARAFIDRPGIIGFVRAVTTPTAILGERADGSREVVFARKPVVYVRRQNYVPPTVAAMQPAVRERIGRAIAEALAALKAPGTVDAASQ
jgi:hypothetical protein